MALPSEKNFSRCLRCYRQYFFPWARMEKMGRRPLRLLRLQNDSFFFFYSQLNTLFSSLALFWRLICTKCTFIFLVIHTRAPPLFDIFFLLHSQNLLGMGWITILFSFTNFLPDFHNGIPWFFQIARDSHNNIPVVAGWTITLENFHLFFSPDSIPKRENISTAPSK